MINNIKELEQKKLIQPPKWLSNNLHYSCIMGSFAYGVSSDHSDLDIYGWAIPPINLLFPHTAGEITGFGRQIKRFEQYQEHHIKDESDKMYDITIYSIVKYFQLCMENNPNMIDSLFVPQNCILTLSEAGNLVRENRKLFLHKGCFHKLKGYAFSQAHKMKIKNPEEGSKRYEDVKKHGFDVKFAYHVVRLLEECQEILETGDLTLDKNSEKLKAIRRGEWTEAQVMDYFNSKEKYLEELYQTSKLQYEPDEAKIKELLLNCLESHYGSLSKIMSVPVFNDKEEIYSNFGKEVLKLAKEFNL